MYEQLGRGEASGVRSVIRFVAGTRGLATRMFSGTAGFSIADKATPLSRANGMDGAPEPRPA